MPWPPTNPVTGDLILILIPMVMHTVDHAARADEIRCCGWEHEVAIGPEPACPQCAENGRRRSAYYGSGSDGMDALQSEIAHLNRRLRLKDARIANLQQASWNRGDL